MRRRRRFSSKLEVAREPRGSASALFPDAGNRALIDNRLTRVLIASIQRVAEGEVTPKFDLENFKGKLADFDFQSPRPLDELLSWTTKQMEQGLVHVTHPRYFGLFNPAPTFPAQCAERIVSAFNPQLATATTSPAAVEIEAHVIRSIARRAGFPIEATGHFTSGGSEANYTALLCALTRATPDFATKGARGFDGPPVFYVSRESHLAWIKLAHQTGIGRSAVRLVATDGFGRMDHNALKEAIVGDRRGGRVPFMIAATAGTTNAGMIDPLSECAELARSNKLWYHVDAAWGGALIASDRLRHVLRGIERADSVTIDAHKWFATTMGCGMFITRYPNVLSSAFQVSTSFMPSNNSRLDPYVNSVQWSRRFLGLRLFLSLATAGWSGYAEHVERSVALADMLKAQLLQQGWSVVNSSPLAVLCITPPPGFGDVRSIVARVLASGRAWIAVASFEGSDIIRACVTNGETTPYDVLELVRILIASGDAQERAISLETDHGRKELFAD
jgi:glutamate/tyrosine decarboxylase-like PLP-dependent enzyme